MSSIHPTTGRRISLRISLLRNTPNQESPTTTRWEDLPEECWELVFDRLKYHHHYHDHHHHRPDRHLESVSLVCKQFLSISNRLRLSLNIIDPLIPSKSNSRYRNGDQPHTYSPRYQNTHSLLLRRFPHLNRINLVEFHGDLDLLLTELAQSGLNLQALDISKQKKFPEKGVKELGESEMKNSLKILICARLHCGLLDKDLIVIGDALPYLEELDISYPEKHEKQLSHILSDLSDAGIEKLSLKLPNLRKIDISRVRRITSLSVLAISSNCVFLTHITADNFMFLCRNTAIRSIIYNSHHLNSLTVTGKQSLTPIPPEYLPANIPPTAIIESSLVTSKNLSVLDFSWMVISDEFLFSVREADFPLKKLALLGCRGFTINGIESLLCAYRSLKHLDLQGTDFLTDQSVSDLSKYMHDLNFIGLDSCSQLTSSTFFTLARNCLSLQEIRMESTSLGENNCRTGFLGKNLAIRVLKFACNTHLNDKTLEKIGFVCPKLESLDVSICRNITEHGIHEIGKRCSEIRELKFASSKRICDFLVTPNSSEFSKLEVLIATETRIKDKGVSRVGCNCIGLQRLILTGCVGVTEKGMEEVVKKCKSLRELNLMGCSMTTDAFLRSIVLSCPSLREICPPGVSLMEIFPPPGDFISYKKQRDWFLRHGCMVAWFIMALIGITITILYQKKKDWHYH